MNEVVMFLLGTALGASIVGIWYWFMGDME